MNDPINSRFKMTEEELFHLVLAKPPAERAAFLDQACRGNASLRAQVDALLAAYEAPGSFLKLPGTNLLGGDSVATEDVGLAAESAVTREYKPNDVGIQDAAVPGTSTNDYSRDGVAGVVIGGRFTLQKKIGEGGMGEVWVAKQTEPVKRRVAVKLIKTGMDSKSVLHRFDQERQALALMDHPNIARVLDGGITPTGQPFFVMELVNGLPLNQFCDELKLTLKQRLELFVPICQAVQHAHQKGIVHRDLKPANILVTMIDARPVPKVIDFGVAKATSGKITEATMSTAFGAVVGTLEYMAPEQAGFSGEDIDTRADIYSLGVILYEMLTGLRPIDAKRLRKAALTELIRIIQEEEPSKPSHRLSTDESLPSLAAMRQTEPKKLMSMLKGELDWVVMKALEKDRTRRYETANSLVCDIQRYLAGEVVEARPASSVFRLKKFLIRHKLKMTAVGLVLLTLTVGFCVSTYFAVIASSEAKAARIAENKAEFEAAAAKRAEAEAKEARRQAERESRAANWQARLANDAKHAIQIDLALRAREDKDFIKFAALIDEMSPQYRSDWETRYLRTVYQRESPIRASLKGHKAHVTSVAVSLDGKQILTASLDKTARLWNAESGKENFELDGHSDGVWCVAFNSNGTRAITGGMDHTARIWDCGTGKELFVLTHNHPTVRSVAFSPDGKQILTVCSTMSDCSARVWDAETGREQYLLSGNVGFFDKAVFSSNGKSILTGGLGEDAPRLWDAETGKEKFVLKGHDDIVCDIVFSPDGTSVLSGSYDKTARVWDVESGNEKLVLEGHEASVLCVAFSPDGKRIITGSGDGTAKLWDADTGNEKLELKGHAGSVICVGFNSAGKQILTASADKTARVWNAETGQNEISLIGHPREVAFAKFLPESNAVVTASLHNDNCARVWSESQRANDTLIERRTSDASAGSYCFSTVFSRDCNLLLCGCEDASARINDTWTGREKCVFGGHEAAVTSVMFSPDEKRVLTGSRDTTARVWDTATGLEILVLKGHTNEILSVAYAPNGKHMVTQSFDNTASIWDAETGKKKLELSASPGLRAMFSPDGRHILVGSSDNIVKVYNADTGQEVTVLNGHNAAVTCAAFSVNGQCVITGSLDKTARVWDVETGQLKVQLKEHEEQVWGVVLSHDSTSAITLCSSMGSELTATVWDVVNAQKKFILKGHKGRVTGVAFSPDSHRIITVGEDDTARVWDAQTGQSKIILEADTTPLSVAMFSPDGKNVIVGTSYGTAQVWDTVIENE